jgi:5-methylcytosine-specific restriction endonuclease McrA
MDAELIDLTDNELEARVKCHVGAERCATADVIAHLAEFDARRLYLPAGFSSLFTYCCGPLRLSESEAYNRIEAARAMRRFPRILNLLRDGALNLTTVRLIAPHLVDGDDALLDQACGKSRREVEELVAARNPKADVPALVRKLPVRQPDEATPGIASLLAEPPAQAQVPRVVPSPVPLPSPSATVMPLASDRYVIRFTASAAIRAKLQSAQDLLRHAIPTGDVAEIVDRALTALLDDLARKKTAATEHPRDPVRRKREAGRSRHIPAAVKRAAWLRDGGRCAFVSRKGHRCTERAFVEYHHVDPYAAGGQATVENIELRCRSHNGYEAELFFGSEVVQRARTRSGTSSPVRGEAAPPAMHGP